MEVKDEWDTLGEEALSNTRTNKPIHIIPLGLQVCLFINTYGPAAYRDSSYPTSDDVIPFKLFILMFETINRVKAFNIISDQQAVALGNAQVSSDDKGQRKITRILQQHHKTAFGEE